MGDPVTTEEAAAQIGASYFQLNRWCTRGWIPGQSTAAGSGRYRRWTPEQVEVARWLTVASKSFAPGVLNLPVAADFCRRAAAAGVKP